MMLRVLFALVALWLAGCGSVNTMLRGGAKLEAVDISAEPPGQVAVVLTAEAAGEPLDRLLSTSFQVYEDGELVDPSASKQTLLDPASVTSFHTMLLLDLSGDAAVPQNRAALARAAATFVELVRRNQPVTVYGFDGAPTPVKLAEYPQTTSAPPLGTIQEVESFQPRDASRDLRSNVLAALNELNTRLNQAAMPLHAGTLVVFTQGPDMAGRVEEDLFYSKVVATKRDVVVIHLEEKPHNEIKQLGNRGLLHLDQIVNAGPVFEGAAVRVGALKDRHYLLSYCSPSRAGKRLLRIDVTGFDEDGNEKRGNVSLEFDSTGFGPGCDANATPRFGSGAAGAAAPRPPPTAPPTDAASEPAPSTEPPPAATDPATAPSDDASDDTQIVPPPDRPGYGD